MRGTNPKIEIVNSIWFLDGDFEIELPDAKPCLAIFDVTPHRLINHCIYADEDNYILPDTCIDFIKDVISLAAKEGFRCLYKAKRDIGKLAHPSYRKMTEHLFNENNLVIVEPSKSPYDVISKSSIVVCLPFTAPAIIAREMNKPVCYYDPTETLDTKHPAAHGIKILKGKKNLLNWIKLFSI